MNAEEIFQIAVAKTNGAERQKFLAEAYASFPQLQEDVEKLIKANESAANVPDSKNVGKQIGPYLLIREIGRGGMGVVYLANDLRLDRRVAIKLLPDERSLDTQWLQRFRREARSASALNHPNILTIYEVGEADGVHFIATEYVNGITLRQKLSNKPCSVGEAIGYATQLASAIAAAHAARVVHRDLKPDNVMVRHDGLLKVLDFGLAKITDTPVWSDNGLSTQSFSDHFSSEPGIIIGTVSFMSPEQARGQKIDARTDIFSFGIMMFLMLTGEHPFKAESAMDVMAAILNHAPKPLSNFPIEIPAELGKIVFKCLSKDREKRFSSEELLSALKQFQINHPVEVAGRAGQVGRDDVGQVAAAGPGDVSTRLMTDTTNDVPSVRYARSGDVNIAYQVIGNGPIDLVFVMGWVSHLEWFWKEPSFSAFLRRLAKFCRVILFDKRGTGLSDKVPINELPTLEQRMDDVRAVMDAVGSHGAVLCGVSEGGPMCSLFAATYPEKTIALVMIGSYARRLRADDYPWGPTNEQREHFLEEIRCDWGGPVGLEDRAPSRAADPEFRNWWATYLRMGASPGAAVALTNMNAQIDVRPILPSVQVPTLVIHRTDDRCLSVGEGRYLAEKIPGAKFVELPGNDHLPFVGDSNAILDEIEEFLTGERHAIQPDRLLATVLYISVENASTDNLDSADDSSVGKRFYSLVERNAELFRGRHMTFANNSVLLTFDGPARAIRAGNAVRDLARRLKISVRIAVHTGECEIVDEHVRGIAVDQARQIAMLASIGEVLLSDTVKNLVVGSGLEFVERATIQLANDQFEHRVFQAIG